MKLNEATVQLVITGLWFLLVVPTVVWWSESTLWIGIMSIYAIVVSHYTAYLAAKKKK